MDARLLTRIGLRLLAVYLFGLGFSLLPEYFSFIYGNIPPNSSTGDWQFYFSLVLTPFAFGVVLWFLAPYLSKLPLGKQEQDATISKDVATWQTAGFTVLGVYFVVAYAPVIVGLLIDAMRSGFGTPRWQGGDEMAIVDHLVVAVFRVALGVILVLGANYFTRLFHRLRESSLPPASGQ